MFHLVFNGQISVDTKATKRQQRDAIKRLKRCNKERHREKDLDKHLMSSKVNLNLNEVQYSLKLITIDKQMWLTSYLYS